MSYSANLFSVNKWWEKIYFLKLRKLLKTQGDKITFIVSRHRPRGAESSLIMITICQDCSPSELYLSLKRDRFLPRSPALPWGFNNTSPFSYIINPLYFVRAQLTLRAVKIVGMILPCFPSSSIVFYDKTRHGKRNTAWRTSVHYKYIIGIGLEYRYF